MNQNISEQEFFELAKNRNRYKVKKRLTGELAYAAVGDIFHSDTLYDRGYNINQLLIDEFLELVPRIFAFEKIIVGKNLHTVFTVCPQCSSHGVNTPLEKTCGNCGYTETRTYYDAETIERFISEQGQREGGWLDDSLSTMQLNIGRLEINCFDEDGEMSIKVGKSSYQSLSVQEAKELASFIVSHIKNETESNPESTPTEDLKEQGQAAGVWVKWVKASNGLPEYLGSVHWRDANVKCPIGYGAAYVTIKRGDKSTIEWLNENPTQ